MALWTPDKITTALWLDAADSSTITESGGAVSQWADKSGNGRDATQATGSAQPALTSDAINSLDALTFDGSNDRLDISNPPINGTTPRSIFAVVRPHTYGDSGVGFLALESGMTEDGSMWYQCIEPDGFYIRVRGNAFWTPTPALNTPHLSSVIWASGGVDDTDVFSNGTPLALAGGNYKPINTASTHAVIGATLEGAFPHFDGDIAEIVIVASAVDTPTRQKTEGYLAHKWGLAANLPAEHPYKDAAPIILSLFGTITDKDSNPAERRITVLDSAGHCVATDTSDPITGTYNIEMPNDDPYTLVFDGEPDRNAQVFANVIPGEPPA